MKGQDWLNWWFACGKKVDYKSEETAWQSANRMNEKGISRNPLEAYQCKFCQGWHVGRKKTLKRKFMRLVWGIWDRITV